MDIDSVAIAAYIVAALLFILSLAGLSRHESAKNGLTYGIVGMAHRPGRDVLLVADVDFADDAVHRADAGRRSPSAARSASGARGSSR